MAKVHYNAPIESMSGALDSDHKFIIRQKHLRDNDGNVVYTCASESFLVSKPRDYKRNPPKGAELAHIRLFGEAARRTTAFFRSVQPDAEPDSEQLRLLEEYQTRYRKQLKGKGDPAAPLDGMGRPKRYFRFDNFVRAMIFQALKAGEEPQEGNN